MKKIGAFILLGLTLTIVTACSPKDTVIDSANDITITDAYDREVSIPQDRSSYICLGTGTLRLYSYVADINQIIGIEEIEQSWGSFGRPYNLVLEDVEDMNVIGTGGLSTSLDLEQILAANPDVIFISDYYEFSVVEQLQETTNIPFVVITYHDIAGDIFNEYLYHSIENIGIVTNNQERATDVIDYIKFSYEDLYNRTKDIEEQADVYLGGQAYKGKHGIESSSGAFKIFDILHLNNVVSAAGLSEHVILDKEVIIQWNPDFIIIDANGYAILYDDFLSNPAYYSQLSAFENHQVYLQMPFNYYSTNLEIALSNAYYIGKMIYPEAFIDINPEEKFDEISMAFLGITSYQEVAQDFFSGYQIIDFFD